MCKLFSMRTLLLALLVFLAPAASRAQVYIGVSVHVYRQSRRSHDIRTVKYSFALSLPREVVAGQLLPSPSLNPVRSVLPGSFQIEF